MYNVRTHGFHQQATPKGAGAFCTSGSGADADPNVDGDCRIPNQCDGFGRCLPQYQVSDTVCTTGVTPTGECWKTIGKCNGSANICNVSLSFEPLATAAIYCVASLRPTNRRHPSLTPALFYGCAMDYRPTQSP